jgi:hypothetical protein
MPINSRNKGASFERKIASELNGWLGTNCRRRISQYQSGGSDLEFIGEGKADDFMRQFSIECKNYQRITDATRNNHWKQAIRQAFEEGKQPLLIFKESRQGVQVQKLDEAYSCAVRMDLEDFIGWVREQL